MNTCELNGQQYTLTVNDDKTLTLTPTEEELTLEEEINEHPGRFETLCGFPELKKFH